MEDTLRAVNAASTQSEGGLNPCFNGRYSQRLKKGKEVTVEGS